MRIRQLERIRRDSEEKGTAELVRQSALDSPADTVSAVSWSRFLHFYPLLLIAMEMRPLL